jgi:hypothetical protein
MMHGFPDDFWICDRIIPLLLPHRTVAFGWLDPRPTGDDELDAVLVEIAGDPPGKGHALAAAAMAARTGLSKPAIGRIWKKVGLKPHLHESFKLGIGELGRAGAQQPVVDAGEVLGRYAAWCR